MKKIFLLLLIGILNHQAFAMETIDDLHRTTVSQLQQDRVRHLDHIARLRRTVRIIDAAILQHSSGMEICKPEEEKR